MFSIPSGGIKPVRATISLVTLSALLFSSCSDVVLPSEVQRGPDANFARTGAPVASYAQGNGERTMVLPNGDVMTLSAGAPKVTVTRAGKKVMQIIYLANGDARVHHFGSHGEERADRLVTLNDMAKAAEAIRAKRVAAQSGNSASGIASAQGRTASMMMEEAGAGCCWGELWSSIWKDSLAVVAGAALIAECVIIEGGGVIMTGGIAPILIVAFSGSIGCVAGWMAWADMVGEAIMAQADLDACREKPCNVSLGKPEFIQSYAMV